MIKYAIGAFDVIRAKDLNVLDEKIQKSKAGGANYFALGIYTDKLMEELGMSTPLKSTEDRMKIMSNMRGIDFVFPVESLTPTDQRDAIDAAFKGFLERKKSLIQTPEKPYLIGYAPGTYDLFHAGHLENLCLAAADCEKLIVGVKSDKLVFEHKHKNTTIDESERMEIIRHLRFVTDVYKYFTRDPNVANAYIKAKYGRPIDAIFLGSDLRSDFAIYEKDFNIVFTERDPELMKVRSTTAYKYRLINRPVTGTYTKSRSDAARNQEEQHSSLRTDSGEEISMV